MKQINTTDTRSETRFPNLTRATGLPRAQDDIVQLTAISKLVMYFNSPMSDMLVCSKNSILGPKINTLSIP